MIGIYQIVNTITGARYIGQSIDIKRRLRQHKRKEQNPNLKKDFENFGIDAFKFEILEECKVEELTKREDYYLKTFEPEYNIRMNGQFISEEARKKMSELQIGKTKPTLSKQVKCVETGEIFQSVRAAAKFAGVAAANMSVLLSGKGRTLGGFHWIFNVPENEQAEMERIKQMPEGKSHSEDTKLKQRRAKLGKKMSAEARMKMRQSQLGVKWKPSTYEKHCRKILCVETEEIFSSIKKAAEKYNVKPPNISAVLAGIRKTSGGFHWKYA